MIFTNTGTLLKVFDEDIPENQWLRIPEGIVAIAGAAFRTVTKPIKRLSLPSTLKRIKKRAFAGVDVYHVRIPRSCRYIEEQAFAGCKNLKTVTSDTGRDTYIQLGNGAFMDCENLVSAALLLKAIPEDAFSGCKKLDMSISPDVETIGNQAFYGSGIKSVIIGNRHKLSYIGERAFEKCKRLDTVSIDTGPDNKIKITISDLAFSNSYTRSVALTGCFALGEMIFEKNEKLTSIRLRDIDYIPYGMFNDCLKLAEADIDKDEVTKIGDFAFCRTQIQPTVFSASVEQTKNSFAHLNKRALRRAVLTC